MSGRGVVVAATPVLSALGMNAVPVVGVLFAGWAPATAMVVYLAETLLIVAVTALRLQLLAPARWEIRMALDQPLVNERRQHRPAPWQRRLPQSQTRAEQIQGFLILAGGFSFASGVFLLFIVLKAGLLDLAATRRVLAPSLLILGAFQLLGLAVDLVLLRQASQDQAELWVKQSLGRVFLIYLAVFIGMFLALFLQATWFVTPFIVLKTIVDVGGPLEQALKQLRGGSSPGGAASDSAAE